MFGFFPLSASPFATVGAGESFDISISEGTRYLDSSIGNLSLFFTLIDTSRFLDSSTPLLDYVGSINESNNYSEVYLGGLAYQVTVPDTVGVSNSQTVFRMDYAGTVQETVIGSDIQNSQMDFVGPLNEVIQFQELFDPTTFFVVSLIDLTRLSDVYDGRVRWETINTSETANWQQINNAQSVTWGSVNTDQNGDWTQIDNS